MLRRQLGRFAVERRGLRRRRRRERLARLLHLGLKLLALCVERGLRLTLPLVELRGVRLLLGQALRLGLRDPGPCARPCATAIEPGSYI